MVDPEWQRVSPVSILFLIISSGSKFLRQQVFSAGPALIAAAYVFDNRVLVLTLGAATILTFIVARAALFYLNFNFKVLEDQIVVRQGTLNKENINLHFERIQNVNVSTPFYFTPFNLVNCQLDSAGSKGSEIVIPGTTKAFATDLSARVLAHQGTVSKSQEIPDDLPTPELEKPVLTLSPLEAAKAGFINGRVLFLAAIGSTFLGQMGDRFEFDVSETIDQALGSLPFTGPFITAGVFAIGFVLVCTGILVFSVLSSLVQNYGFELHEDGARLRRIAGLMERHQTSLKKEKVQGVTIHQNLRARALGRVAVHFHQTGGRKNKQQAESSQKFLIPVIPEDDWPDIVKLAFEDFSLTADGAFQTIDRRYATRNFILLILLPLTLATGVLVILEGLSYLALAALLPMGWFLCRLSHRRFGFWQDEDYAVIRSGLFDVRYTVFPIFKIQQAFEIQTPMQRQKYLKDLGVQLAFKKLTIPWLPNQVVEDFINRSVATVETSSRRWV
jgi:putative membrane protein